MIFTRVINLIIYKLPYSILKLLTNVCGRRQDQIWYKLPFRNFKSLSILPDGNIIICSLEDHGYEYVVYHDSPYDRFFKPEIGDIVVDVGAHVGFYTLKAAKEVGNKGHIIAIEPEDSNYEFLAKNIRINHYSNITIIKSAVSDFYGKANFFLKAQSVSHSLIGKTWITPIVGFTEVTVTTLDNIFKKINIPKVDLLKINVEGAELNVLMGCKEFLAQRRISKIVITPHPPFKQEAIKICKYLKAFDYKTRYNQNEKVIYARIRF